MDQTTTISLLALVVSVISVWIAQSSKRLSFDVQENQTIEGIERKLDSPMNRVIADLINQGKPILPAQRGSTSIRDLEAYLNILEDLQIKLSKRNISLQMLVENGFDEYVLAAKGNREVQAYVQRIRLQNPDYYAGIDALAQRFTKER